MNLLYSDIDGYIADCEMPICYTTYDYLHKEICLFNIDNMDFKVEQEINKGGSKRKNIIEDDSKKNKKSFGGHIIPYNRNPDIDHRFKKFYGKYIYFLTDEEIKEKIYKNEEIIKIIDEGVFYKDDDVIVYRKKINYYDINKKNRYTYYNYKKYKDGYEKESKLTDYEIQRVQDRDG